MKSARTFFIACLAAALLAIPGSAMAWVYQLYDWTGSSFTTAGPSNTTGLTLSDTVVSTTEMRSHTPRFYFSVVSDVPGLPASTVNLGSSITYTGGGNAWGGSYDYSMATPPFTYMGYGENWDAPATALNNLPIITGQIYSLFLYNEASAATSTITANLAVTTPDSKTPIPGTLLLLGPGIAGLAALRRRFKKS